jgi:hypothetical protein
VVAADHQTWAALRLQYWQAVGQAGSAASSAPTREDAEAALNGGKPFETTPTLLGDEARYTDPNTGGRAVLRFRDGKWTGVAGYGASNNPPAPPTSAPVSAARVLLYRGGLVACLLLLVVPWSAPPGINRPRVHWFVATAIASTWLAFLGPGYLRAWNTFFREDSAGWGVFVFMPLAVILLLITYGPPRWRRQPDYPACPRCRYNLTGNRSGVCPECGTVLSPVPPTRPAATSN